MKKETIFGKFLEEKGLSKIAFCRDVGISTDTFYRIENGQKVQSRTINKFADYFGESYEETCKILKQDIVQPDSEKSLLRQHREALRLSRATLAKRAGITESTLVHYECWPGDWQPRAVMLKKIADGLEGLGAVNRAMLFLSFGLFPDMPGSVMIVAVLEHYRPGFLLENDCAKETVENLRFEEALANG